MNTKENNNNKVWEIACEGNDCSPDDVLFGGTACLVCVDHNDYMGYWDEEN